MAIDSHWFYCFVCFASYHSSWFQSAFFDNDFDFVDNVHERSCCAHRTELFSSTIPSLDDGYTFDLPTELGWIIIVLILLSIISIFMFLLHRSKRSAYKFDPCVA